MHGLRGSCDSPCLPVLLVPAFIAGQIVIPTNLSQECLKELRNPGSNISHNTRHARTWTCAVTKRLHGPRRQPRACVGRAGAKPTDRNRHTPRASCNRVGDDTRQVRAMLANKGDRNTTYRPRRLRPGSHPNERGRGRFRDRSPLRFPRC